jgi:DNA transposition AAA+ family ATPase
MITHDLKLQVVDQIKHQFAQFGGSQAKYATSIGISGAQLSRILKGDTDKVLSEGIWLTIARKLNVSIGSQMKWKTAETPTYIYVNAMLAKCKKESISALICDAADIGKTHAAKLFCFNNKHAVYVDCSQVKSKQKLVRAIAKEFGVDHSGKYQDVYDDLVFYVKTLQSPLIVLDEAGDLSYEAFLELKALWNATEYSCGWVMIGADGLKVKVRRAIDHKKVGYTEIFSRYGKRYQRVTPEGKQEQELFIRQQAALIIQANAPQQNLQKMIASTEGSLRRIRNEISKLS